jgi:hypothetical protein
MPDHLLRDSCLEVNVEFALAVIRRRLWGCLPTLFELAFARLSARSVARRRRLFHVQKRRSPDDAADTVSGLTITARFAKRATRDNHAQSHRSAVTSRNRGRDRLRTEQLVPQAAICCSSAVTQDMFDRRIIETT